MSRFLLLPAVGALLLLSACTASPSSTGTPTDGQGTDPAPAAVDCTALLTPLQELSSSGGVDLTWSVSDAEITSLDADVRAQSCAYTNDTISSALVLVPTSVLTLDDYTAALTAAGYEENNGNGNWYAPDRQLPVGVGSAAGFAGIIPAEASDLLGDYFIILEPLD